MILVSAVAAVVALQTQGGLGLPPKYQKASPKPAQAVARVNGQPVTAAEVEGLLWDWRAQEAIQDAISYLMVKQEAAKKGIVVSDAEVEKAVDAHRAALAANEKVDVSAIDARLAEQGFKRSRLFLRVKSQLLLDRLVERGFQPADYVRVSTIVFRPASEQATALSDVIAKAQGAYERLQKGEAWDKVLAESNQDPNVARTKGALGWKDLAAFPESVREEMSALKVGGVTRPAQTPNGIQIFRFEARGHEVQGEELAALRRLYLDGARQATIQRLRATAKIERIYP